ncbi:unnamed protein product, partial [Linum tenue]
CPYSIGSSSIYDTNPRSRRSTTPESLSKPPSSPPAGAPPENQPSLPSTSKPPPLRPTPTASASSSKRSSPSATPIPPTFPPSPSSLTDPELTDLFDRIYSYGSTHRARTFHFTDLTLTTAINPFPPKIHLPLRNCQTPRNFHQIRSPQTDRRVLESPNLTSLRLCRCVIPTSTRTVAVYSDQERCIHKSFESMPNVEKLELVHCEFETTIMVKVSGEKLVEIVIVGDDVHQHGVNDIHEKPDVGSIP